MIVLSETSFPRIPCRRKVCGRKKIGERVSSQFFITCLLIAFFILVCLIWRPNVFRAFNGGGGQESRSTFLRNLESLEFIVCTGDRKKVWSCIVYRLLHVREKVTSACRRYFLSAVLNRALWSPVCIYI